MLWPGVDSGGVLHLPPTVINNSPARGTGYRCLWLGVWEHNHRVNAFYERRGFATVGIEPFCLQSDDQADLLMQLVMSKGAV
jgi:ribosomal protein S18 acetylase RimI-like enzyme